MTKKEFKEAMLRGQGRCIQAVRSDPEKYRSIVLWACSHEVAFDPQCEGCRSAFMYEIIGCYEDKTPFLRVLMEELRKTKSNGRWKVLYLAEVLSYFANDGVKDAAKAVWDKYEVLYGALLKKKQRPEGVFPERDDFESLCLVLGSQKIAMVKIAEDIGRLYRTKEFCDGNDFEWLFDSCAKKIMGTLKKQAEKSENIASYLRESEKTEVQWQQPREQNHTQLTGVRLSRWLKNKADGEIVRQYAEAYLLESNPNGRAKALEAFCRCPFPCDPMPIIEDAKSEHPELREAAWQAMENIRHPLVREFALEQLAVNLEDALPVLLVNYQSQDEKLLSEYVKSIKVDFACTTNWHGAQLDVLGMKEHGLKAPGDLLCYIYETTYCSCCREYALLQMGKRRLLTPEILEECLHDSNYDIRAYAKRCLVRRKEAGNMDRRNTNGTL